MSTASASTCEQEVHRQINPSKRPDELPRAEVDFDLHASMLCSDGWTKAPPRTRIYRQVRTDVFEFFTEVRSTSGILQRVLPWKMRPSPAGPASPAADAVAPAQQALEAVCNFGIVLGGYVSGVLGGMAVMTILHLNLFNVNTAIGRSDLALQYYAPVALAVNRTYWGLICIAISSSISRSHSGHSSVAAVLESTTSAAWSTVAVVCYVLAFIVNIAHSDVDSELDYAVDRNSNFYTAPLPQKFLERVELWRILNSVKSAALILAWFAVVLEWQPRRLAQLIQTNDNSQPNSPKMKEKHQDTNPNIHCALNCKSEACDGKTSSWSGRPLESAILHTNPAFHHTSAEHMPIYPSAGAGLARDRRTS